jgi:hypothetical protein
MNKEAIRGVLGWYGWLLVARCGRGGLGHVAPRSASDIMRRLHGPERGDITAFSFLGRAVFRTRLWKGWRPLPRDPDFVVNVVLISLKIISSSSRQRLCSRAPMAVYTLQTGNRN